jgi:hypothetical protein
MLLLLQARLRCISKALALAIVLLFVVCGMNIPSTLYAQDVPYLPAPGNLLQSSQAFNLVMLKGVIVDAENPFKLKFILDEGDMNLTDAQLKDETNILIRYFLSALTIPASDMWVNLSPYESNRIVPEEFGLTDIGRDMLGQDYILKQLASSLTHPETEAGKKYWDDNLKSQISNLKSNAQALQKVWIVPGKTQILESGAKAYISQMSMKVMTEEDYLARQANTPASEIGNLKSEMSGKNGNNLKSQISNVQSAQNVVAFKRHILPLIEKDVNGGANFAYLRQMQSAIILALWFKDKLKASIYAQLYIDKKKIAGVDSGDSQAVENIYKQYVQSFKVGAYQYAKKDLDTINHRVVNRQYYSGGIKVAGPTPVKGVTDNALEGAIGQGKEVVTVELTNRPGDSPRPTPRGQGGTAMLALVAALGLGGTTMIIDSDKAQAAPRASAAKRGKLVSAIPTTAKDYADNVYARAPDGSVLIDPKEWNDDKAAEAIEVYNKKLKETNSKDAALLEVAAHVGNQYIFLYDEYRISFIGDDSGKVVTVDSVKKPREKKLSKAEAAKRDENIAKIEAKLREMLEKALKTGQVLNGSKREVVAEADDVVFIGFITNLINGNVKGAEQQADGGFLAPRSAETMKILLTAYKAAYGIEDAKPDGVAKALEEWRVSLREYAKKYYNMELTDEQMALAEKIHMLPGGWRRLTKEERKRYDAAPFGEDGIKTILIDGEERNVYVMFNNQPGVTTCTLGQIKDKLAMGLDTEIEELVKGGIRKGIFGVEDNGGVGGITQDGLRLEIKSDGKVVPVFKNIPIDVDDFKGFGFKITAIGRNKTGAQIILAQAF